MPTVTYVLEHVLVSNTRVLTGVACRVTSPLKLEVDGVALLGTLGRT